MYSAFQKPAFLQKVGKPCIMCPNFKQNNRDTYGLRFGICDVDGEKKRYDEPTWCVYNDGIPLSDRIRAIVKESLGIQSPSGIVFSGIRRNS